MHYIADYESTVLDRGQTTIPLQLRKYLNLTPGSIAEIDTTQGTRIILKRYEGPEPVQSDEPYMYYPKVTEKGQIALPKDFIERYGITVGQVIRYSLYSNSSGNDLSHFAIIRISSSASCFLCGGSGSVDGHECIMCGGSGETTFKENSLRDLHLRITPYARKYGFSFQILNNCWCYESNTPMIYVIPIVSFNPYPKMLITERTLDRLNDYYQVWVIKEYAPLSTLGNGYLIPSDSILDAMLSLLKTEAAKDEITRLFRNK